MRSIVAAIGIALILTVAIAVGFRNMTSQDTGESATASAFSFICPDGTTVGVTYADDQAVVNVGDDLTMTLPRAPSASGARYAEGMNEFWEHQGEASVTLTDGTRLTGCKLEK